MPRSGSAWVTGTWLQGSAWMRASSVGWLDLTIIGSGISACADQPRGRRLGVHGVDRDQQPHVPEQSEKLT
jgi:hypothetical protein